MKYHLNLDNLPTPEQQEQWKNDLQNVKYGMQPHKVSLSMEERLRSRKIGSRRLSYAHASDVKGGQYEQVMPRQFDPTRITKSLQHYHDMKRFSSFLQELQEIVYDNMVAAGIDAMTCTKIIHDSLRLANLTDPSLDSALQELDEYNRRAQAEDEEEEANNTQP